MKIGLVLSGGGARGISHLGVIQALQEEDIKFDIVSGVSAGAIVGAFIAANYTPKETLEFIEKTSMFDAFQLALNRRSFLRIEKAARELEKYFPEDTFESLDLPFRVTTTDIRKGKIKVFKKGQLIKPLLASCSIPVVFDPVKINSRYLVDGGILDNLPVSPIKKQADFIIALHCNPIDPKFNLSNWRNLMERTMMMTVTQLAYGQKKKCDLFLEPPGLSQFSAFSFNKAREIYEFGYEYAKTEIENGILDALTQRQR
ncbi:patatin-like phospholipase family protein [Marinoscillum sp. MHG1-6]|uniref:patatin-like phospholipase family protein n=1 Tax=Marinoscillum sp. MHG1-6 TaxID=2959627 RepID=UPI00280B9A6C|nr:patatin-like phospholipase family protein [Marinoscillum sp. MHG1-6]